MKSFFGYACALLVLSCLLVIWNSSVARADPCGMVPPVLPTADNIPITRIGPQKTYVFYNYGLETFIIRPGYEGRVDEFGMLIPFPTPPAIRKAPDNVFEQIANAIDPPEVVVDLRPQPTGGFFGGGGVGGGLGGGGGGFFGGLGFVPEDKVVVLREEAVGMYEVAVLAAGSSKALKKWMDDHKYKYPTGMDGACNDYVKIGWCFVAVKTRVATKDGADPKPAQRRVDADLPDGAVFNGHVQAMEFRFPSRELVVPMRLSAFNEGETRNVVYLLAEKPAKIRAIPEEYVMRQMSGDELYGNLTEPLPLRILGGDVGDISPARRRQLKTERDPTPYNGIAAEVFAGDLIAAKTQRLLSQHEEIEKELISIGEELDLRGMDFDIAVSDYLAAAKRRATDSALKGLKDMALTVVDGEFPREVLARQNLTFAQYNMPRQRSKPQFYDAKELGPAPKKEGKLKLGWVDWRRVDRIAAAESPADETPGANDRPLAFRHWLSAVLAIAGVALLLTRARRWWPRLVVLAAAVALSAVAARVVAGAEAAKVQAEQPDQRPAKEAPAELEKSPDKSGDKSAGRVVSLVRDLSAADKARGAIDELETIGPPAVERLVRIAYRDGNLARRGWALAALSRIGGEDARQCAARLSENKSQPELIRIWASAASIKMAETPEQLDALAHLIDDYPSLERPFAKTLQKQVAAKGEDVSVAAMLALTLRDAKYDRALGKTIMSAGAAALVKEALSSKNQNVRQKAAGYLATLDAAGDETIAGEMLKALNYNAQAEHPPWHGGPLFVPALAWKKEDAQQLAASLLAWHHRCGKRKQAGEQDKISIVLGSVSLAQAAGYAPLAQKGTTTDQWLAAMQGAFGGESGKSLAELLKAQGVEIESLGK